MSVTRVWERDGVIMVDPPENTELANRVIAELYARATRPHSSLLRRIVSALYKRIVSG